MPSKFKSYDKATQALMLQATNLDVTSDSIFSLPEMVYLLRESFKYKLTYYHVFNERRPAKWEPSTGFCLVSSYYIFLHTGGNAVWEIKSTPVHWWLEHRQTGQIFDITSTQFKTKFPYELGQTDTSLETDPILQKVIQDKAIILGKSARMD